MKKKPIINKLDEEKRLVTERLKRCFAKVQKALDEDNCQLISALQINENTSQLTQVAGWPVVVQISSK